MWVLLTQSALFKHCPLLPSWAPIFLWKDDRAQHLSVCPHRAVLFASMLMHKTMASRVRATILFATETGKSETLAQDLGALFSCAFNPKVPDPLDMRRSPACVQGSLGKPECLLCSRMPQSPDVL